jgi:putative membrane protein
MGMADAVPGVSGGTIALILGIYNKLIFSLSDFLSFFRKRFPSQSYNQFMMSFQFLFTLGLGMIVSYYVITKILVGSENQPGLLLKSSTAPFIFSLFFGLVLSSVKEPWQRVSDRNIGRYVLCFTGFSLVLLYTNLSLNNDGGNFILVVSGALALTAMLLPGISGALVLLTLGQYAVVANAVHDSNFSIILYFLCGGLIGLFTFVPFMNFMLLNYKEDVMSVLTGLMLGSLATLWPWKETYGSKGVSPNLGLGQVFDNFTLVSIIGTICFGFLGFALYLALKSLEKEVN